MNRSRSTSVVSSFTVITSRTQATLHSTALGRTADVVVVGKGKKGAFYPTLRARVTPAQLIVDRPTGSMLCASPDDVYDLENEGLFEETLASRLADQCHPRVGNDVELVPIRYLGAQDGESLRGILDNVEQLDMTGRLLKLPLDRRWFTGSSLRRLIAVLNKLDCDVALLPGGERRDPLSTQESLRGIRVLASECPRAVLWNTDLAGFWSMANGAPGCGLGTATGLRHTLQPLQSGDAINPSDTRPSVLDAGLYRFLSGTMLDRIGSVRFCTANCCNDAALSSLGPNEVYRHNLFVARELFNELAVPEGLERYIDSLTTSAVEHARNGLKPPDQLGSLFRILEIPIRLDR